MTRSYAVGLRTFDVFLVRRLSRWTVKRITDASQPETQALIPGIRAIAVSSPDEAFARACDCIDKWLFRQSAT